MAPLGTEVSRGPAIVRRSLAIFVAAALASLAGTRADRTAHAEPIFDAAADFSLASNPNGVWSYGYSSVLGASPTTYTFATTVSDIASWSNGNGIWAPPWVGRNDTDQVVTFSSITLQPYQMAFHPGSSGEYSVIRFTAPSAGVYALVSSFIGVDGTTTDVHVLHNGTSLFSGSINGYGDSDSYSTNVVLATGDAIDFAVGYLTGGYSNDSTGISATLTPMTTVPEIAPAGIGLVMALVSGGLALLERRRRAA